MKSGDEKQIGSRIPDGGKIGSGKKGVMPVSEKVVPIPVIAWMAAASDTARNAWID